MNFARDVTFAVTSIERDGALMRLLRSLVRVYPDNAIDVAYQGDIGDDWVDQIPTQDGEGDIRLYTIPYDTGLGAARNILADRCETSHIFYLDDDMIVDHRSNLPRCVRPDGLAACRVVGRTRRLWTGAHPLEHTPDGGIRLGTPLDKPGPAGFVPNALVGPARAFQAVRWDDAIKVGWEHLDWCMRALDTTTVVYCPYSTVVEKSFKDSRRYRDLRGRNQGHAEFFTRWNVAYVEWVNGWRVYPDRPNLVRPGAPPKGKS